MLTGVYLEEAILGANICSPVCACAFAVPCSPALLCAVVQAVNRTGYKWMLYGDDDTMWFVGGVLDVLKDLDPEMPYIITGKQSVFGLPAGKSCSAKHFITKLTQHTLTCSVDFDTWPMS